MNYQPEARRSTRSRGAMRGFTIVELIVVIIVIAILAALVLVGYRGVQARAGEVALKSNLTNAATSLEHYYQSNGKYPTSAGDVDGTGTSAQFSSPISLVVASNGTIYVADAGNHRIRTISEGGTN